MHTFTFSSMAVVEFIIPCDVDASVKLPENPLYSGYNSISFGDYESLIIKIGFYETSRQ